jgi:hypothetical protein
MAARTASRCNSCSIDGMTRSDAMRGCGVKAGQDTITLVFDADVESA